MNKVHVAAPSPLFLLFLVFLTLKLTNVIGWSWWFVTMPLWGGIVIILSVLIIIFLIAVILGGIALIFDK